MEEVGTLRDLDVKKGDVVEFVKASDWFHPRYTEKYGGTNSIVDVFGGTEVHDDGSQGWSDECDHIFRIVSRAPRPREFWVSNNDGFAHDSLESVLRDPLTEKHGYIRVREVLE